MALPTGVSRPPCVEEVSAGGIVVDVLDGHPWIAVMARRNRMGRLEWCLPKGHRERGETLTETAVREVMEETGIIGRVLVPLGIIDYWFTTAERRVHKVVHHYLLEALGGEISVENDPDQEGVDAKWVPLDAAPACLTFANEQRMARLAWQCLYAKTA